MERSKVIFADETLIDLTNDTVSPDKLLSGETAHDKTGALISGNVIVVNYTEGIGPPSDSFGSDGDLYLDVSD